MKIPQSIQNEAKRIYASPQRVWSEVFIAFDFDFQEWFCTPFLETGDDNLISVAKVKHGEVVPA